MNISRSCLPCIDVDSEKQKQSTVQPNQVTKSVYIIVFVSFWAGINLLFNELE